MDSLNQLERILASIDFLADTFLALEIALQNKALELPSNALTVPTEILKEYSANACKLCGKLITEGIS